MSNYKLDQMSVNEIKVYVAELEAKIKVYESVIANSNFRAIVIRPDEDKPKYTRGYKGKKPYKADSDKIASTKVSFLPIDDEPTNVEE